MLSAASTGLALLGRRAALAMPLGLAAGLLVPPLAELAAPLILPAIVIPFVIALMRLDAERLKELVRAPLLPLLLVAWTLAGTPLLVAVTAAAAGLEEPLDSLAVTMAACAPLMASGALALILGLDVALAVLSVTLATFLVPLSLPPLVAAVAGLPVELPTLQLTLRLAAIVGGSFLLARILRSVIGEARIERSRQAMDGIAVLFFLLFACAVMNGVHAIIGQDLVFLLRCVLVAFALNAGLQLVTVLLLWGLGRRVALTAGLLAGNCNIGLLLAASADTAPPALLAFIAAAQFPIYLLPSLQKPLYARLLAKDASR
ncbi:hypothetical protein [Marinimicrococcus flavescens]|uniref:Uncharacterized protein n=1 Tax=Marinimicrococcus flavescens TaxID=3031815 RepID=A0AAP3UYZ6_9PROT|nr:hypothetical protein [Marinimicrococcus flavescens]